MRVISYQDAIKIINDQVSDKNVADGMLNNRVSINIVDSIGRISARTYQTKFPLPSFNNSAMDGYALSSSITEPIKDKEVSIVGRSAAGDAPGKGESGAWEIMTGAPMPEGFNRVVPVENTKILHKDEKGRISRILILQEPLPDHHVRFIGEDTNVGDVLLSKGDRINGGAVMALAAQGIKQVEVQRMPKIALCSTGAELINIEENTGTNELETGRIWNSNQPYLEAILKRIGCDVENIRSVGDDSALFAEMIEYASHSVDVIVTTGAVSMGVFDFVPSALKSLGAKILFHKVAVRPGKPVFYARLPNGTHFIGLAGNPASAAAGLNFFVLPLIRAIVGLAAPKTENITLTNSFIKNNSLTQFLKARKYINELGTDVVEILEGQESFKISPLINANGWVIAPADCSNMSAGDSVQFAEASNKIIG